MQDVVLDGAMEDSLCRGACRRRRGRQRKKGERQKHRKGEQTKPTSSGQGKGFRHYTVDPFRKIDTPNRERYERAKPHFFACLLPGSNASQPVRLAGTAGCG